MSPIAALAMYDWPEVAEANDDLWSFIAGRLQAQGIAAPSRLDRSQRYFEPWLSPDLLLAQTCAYPFATALRGRVHMLGTPCYQVFGCLGPYYTSILIASRSSGIRSIARVGDARIAVNSLDSQSGYWALRAAIAGEPGDPVTPAKAVLSGGHRESLRMVAEGGADVAAIDAVCWALAERHEPAMTAEIHMLGRSLTAPGLPIITALGTPQTTIAALREALSAAMTEPALAQTRAELFLSGFEVLTESTYDTILDLHRLALRLPFPVLTAPTL